MKEYDLDEIESINRNWSNQFAAKCGWEDFDLRDPLEDLRMFFNHIPGITMLDVGCGHGRYVSRFLDQGLVYFGFDHSTEMLKVARSTEPRATFLQGSYRTLPFPDNCFDGIWSCCSLPCMPKTHLVDVLREHRRVIRPNGVMYTIVPMSPHSDEEMYEEEDGSPAIYQSHYMLDELVDYLKRADFTIIDAGLRVMNWSMFALIQKPI